MIKTIITGGCSFSEPVGNAWTNVLTEQLGDKLDIVHTGMGSQGNDLIQKKVIYAACAALKKYKPEEILLLPMWSGTERKAVYIDSKNCIEDIEINYEAKGEEIPWFHFNTLSNSYSDIDGSYHNRPMKGWYIFNYSQRNQHCRLEEEHWKSYSTLVAPVINTVENIIFLQLFAKAHGMKVAHQFYRSYVYQDMLQYRENENVGYLLDMLDQQDVVTTVGMYEYFVPAEILEKEMIDLEIYLREEDDKNYPFTRYSSQYLVEKGYTVDGCHLERPATEIWCDLVIEHIQNKGWIK